MMLLHVTLEALIISEKEKEMKPPLLRRERDTVKTIDKKKLQQKPQAAPGRAANSVPEIALHARIV